MRRKSHGDPVTPALRQAVIERDRGCVGVILEAPGQCRTFWGYAPIGGADYELDHVLDASRMGKRAPSDMDHLVQLCHFHHQGGWATSHRPELRAYLRSVNGAKAEAAA